MTTKQINVLFPEQEATRLKMDAVRLGVTLNDYVLRAFQKFHSAPIEQRRGALSQVRRKTIGRKIAA